MVSETRCGIKKLIYKQLYIKTVIITYGGVTEIFCMADDFCKFFDAMTAEYTLKPTGKRKYHRNSMMSKVDVMQTKATSAKALSKAFRWWNTAYYQIKE